MVKDELSSLESYGTRPLSSARFAICNKGVHRCPNHAKIIILRETYSDVKLRHWNRSSSVSTSTYRPKNAMQPLLPLQANWHLNDAYSLTLAVCVVAISWLR